MPLKKISSVIVLGVDSNYEPVTRAGEEYRNAYVYPAYINNGADVRRLAGSSATRSDFIRESRKPGMDCITGVGHGSYDTYTGNHGSSVLRVGYYGPDEVRGKIIHLLSCQTARDLGPDTVRNGARAFLGYNENFVFYMDICEEFFECDSQIDYVLARGGTAGEAYKESIRRYNFYINKYRELGQVDIAATFELDRDRLRSPFNSYDYGDINARLDDSPDPPIIDPPITDPPITDPPIIDPPPQSGTRVRIITGKLYIRSGPGTNFPEIGSLYRNDLVDFISLYSNEAWVEFEPHKWSAFFYGGNQYMEILEFGRKARVINVSDNLNVRNGPGANYTDIGNLYNGDEVEIIDFDGKEIWMEIESNKWIAFTYNGNRYAELV